MQEEEEEEEEEERMAAPLYEQTVTFANGGLGLGVGLSDGPNNGGVVESQTTTRIGGEKRRVESLRVERETGLGGDFIDVEDGEREDERQQLRTMKKREENEREEEEKKMMKQREALNGKREGDVGNDDGSTDYRKYSDLSLIHISETTRPY